jgi:hypothetical protein
MWSIIAGSLKIFQDTRLAGVYWTLTVMSNLGFDDTSCHSLERNVSTLHRAGADFVMSYASIGANAKFNFLCPWDISR